MKNCFGETVKPQYEVVLKTWSTHAQSVEQAKKDEDYESFSYESADNYRDAVRAAKERSLKIGQVVDGDYGTFEVAAVCIVCYYSDDTSGYNQVWHEYYKDGKKDYRFNF